MGADPKQSCWVCLQCAQCWLVRAPLSCPLASRSELRPPPSDTRRQRHREAKGLVPGHVARQAGSGQAVRVQPPGPETVQGTRMESRGINPLETKLGEGKLNTGKEGAPQNRGEGEELVLSSWEVSHAPYAPRPTPRVTDRLFAVSRRQALETCTQPTGKPRPRGAKGLSEVTQLSCLLAPRASTTLATHPTLSVCLAPCQARGVPSQGQAWTGQTL